MKASELMIGDLVNLSPGKANIPSYVMIHAIKYDNHVSKDYVFDIVFLSTGLVQYNYSIRSLKPIPLTTEILEKNGFKMVRDKLGRVFYSIADDYFDLTIDEITDSIWCIEYDNIEAQFPTCRNLVAHVHELQHALRLCGIDKTIEL